MAEQWIVATLLDGTLNVTACGPYRSHEKAAEVAQKISTAGEWSEHPDFPTIIPQIIMLETAAEVVAEAGAGRMGPS